MVELSERSGARYSAVRGFVKGERDAMLGTASELCRVLGLELIEKPKQKRKK